MASEGSLPPRPFHYITADEHEKLVEDCLKHARELRQNSRDWFVKQLPKRIKPYTEAEVDGIIQMWVDRYPISE